MLKKIFILAGSIALCSCLRIEMNPSESVESPKGSIGLQTARDAGLIDVPLKKIHRYVGGIDHMDRPEAVSVPNYSFQGAGWYILAPSANTTLATNPLYSLYHSTLYDHMTSNFTNEGGYTYEFQFGKAFLNQDLDLGIFPIRRYSKTWTGPFRIDHQTAFDGEVPSGYTAEPIMGYGWPTGNGVGTILNVTKNNITIGTSKNWGGSIVSMIRNGIEFVNRYDAGREIQSAMWYGLDSLNHDNPTEAGDMYSNGSPVINYDLDYPTTGSIRTMANALIWGQGKNGFSQTTPILSGTQILKKVEIQSNNRIKHEVTFYHAKNPTDIANGPQFAWHEPLACYLNDGIFNKVLTYNWNGTTWSNQNGFDLYANENDSSPLDYKAPNSNSTYIMAYNNSTDLGFAIFRKTPTAWNSATEAGTFFDLFRHLCANPGGTATSNQVLKINIAESVVSFSKGSASTYVQYILLGTHAQIRAQADSLRLGQL